MTDVIEKLLTDRQLALVEERRRKEARDLFIVLNASSLVVGDDAMIQLLKSIAKPLKTCYAMLEA